MRDFGAALGLALVLEGVLYFAFPDGMRKAVVAMLAQPPLGLRLIGLGMALAGLGLVWFIRRAI